MNSSNYASGANYDNWGQSRNSPMEYNARHPFTSFPEAILTSSPEVSGYLNAHKSGKRRDAFYVPTQKGLKTTIVLALYTEKQTQLDDHENVPSGKRSTTVMIVPRLLFPAEEDDLDAYGWKSRARRDLAATWIEGSLDKLQSEQLLTACIAGSTTAGIPKLLKGEIPPSFTPEHNTVAISRLAAITIDGIDFKLDLREAVNTQIPSEWHDGHLYLKKDLNLVIVPEPRNVSATLKVDAVKTLRKAIEKLKSDGAAYQYPDRIKKCMFGDVVLWGPDEASAAASSGASANWPLQQRFEQRLRGPASLEEIETYTSGSSPSPSPIKTFSTSRNDNRLVESNTCNLAQLMLSPPLPQDPTVADTDFAEDPMEPDTGDERITGEDTATDEADPQDYPGSQSYCCVRNTQGKLVNDWCTYFPAGNKGTTRNKIHELLSLKSADGRHDLSSYLAFPKGKPPLKDGTTVGNELDWNNSNDRSGIRSEINTLMGKLPWLHLVSGRSRNPNRQSGEHVEVQQYLRSLNTIIKEKRMDQFKFQGTTYYLQFGRNKYKPEEFESGKHYDLIDNISAAVTLKGQVTLRSNFAESLIKEIALDCVEKPSSAMRRFRVGGEVVWDEDAESEDQHE